MNDPVAPTQPNPTQASEGHCRRRTGVAVAKQISQPGRPVDGSKPPQLPALFIAAGAWDEHRLCT